MSTEEKLLQSLDQITTALIKSAEVITDFTSTEIPLVLRELITFQLASRVTYILLIVASLIYLYKAYWKYVHPVLVDDNYSREGEGIVFILIGMIVYSVVTIVVLFFQLNIFMKALVAPRLFILEYLRDFIK